MAKVYFPIFLLMALGLLLIANFNGKTHFLCRQMDFFFYLAKDLLTAKVVFPLRENSSFVPMAKDIFILMAKGIFLCVLRYIIKTVC